MDSKSLSIFLCPLHIRLYLFFSNSFFNMKLGSFSGEIESNDFSALLHVQAGMVGVNSSAFDNPSNVCVAPGELGTALEGLTANFHATDAFPVGYEDALRSGPSGVIQPDQVVPTTGSKNLPSLTRDFKNHVAFGTKTSSLDGAGATNVLAATGQEEPRINSASNDPPARNNFV